MSYWGATLAKIVGAGVVAAIPVGLMLGDFTTDNMRRDYAFGFSVPSEGVEATTPDVPYTVPEKVAIADGPAIYPATPPSAIDPDRGDGFDDEAYLAAYDRQDRAATRDSDYAGVYGDAGPDGDYYRDDYAYADPVYDDGAAREPAYGDDRGWQRELQDADLDSRDDPFFAETRRVRGDRRVTRHARRRDDRRDADYAEVSRHPARAASTGDSDRRGERRSEIVRTPAGTVTVTRAGNVAGARPADRTPRDPSSDPVRDRYSASFD